MNFSVNPCRLLLFVRYPRVGHTKTRLIPALGAVTAANLQRQMAAYLLARVTAPAWALHVHFTGGERADMRAWLGPEVAYRAQQEGDLGARLWAGFQQGFAEGCDRIVAIGADCPDVSACHIRQAFGQLERQDLVLGPARDGGYYLIGLRRGPREQQRLFWDIDWSTSVVFQQTRRRAEQLGLSVAQLEVLSDIDRPEDLAIWQRIQATAGR